jgi:hypothetical protein
LPSRKALEREHLALVPGETERSPSALAGAPVRGFSLLRASVGVRLALVVGAACFLWLAVYWALT